MDKILRKAELSGAVVIGAGIQYPRTANVYIGDDKNGYERGDLVDANAVIDIVDNGDTQDQKDIKKLREDLTIVENKIPEEASSSNQLADKAYVNNGIATNSATFRGTYQSVSELDNVEADNNDYAFVVRTDVQGNSYYDRYKYVENTGWEYEYTIENTQFSQAQLDAINSGATAAKIQKLDKLAAYDGEFVEVTNLPTPSDATMGKVYMVPANPNIVVNWDWENNIPSAIRTQWVDGNDATGTINSDITGIVLSVGPKVAGTYVKFSTNGGLDNVQVNTNTYVQIPIKDAGDTIHFVCKENHHQFTVSGNPAQSDDFTYTVTLADKANGYVEVVSTGYCNFYRIVVTYTDITKATSTDPARNTKDKYVTVLRDNAYVWEQIESAYINLDNFYTKDEVDGVASEVAQSAEQNLIDDERVIAFALNDLDQRIENIPSYVLITWSELKQLRDSDKLIPGTFYRITDFVTTTVQENTQSANHAFDIIVRADDTDVLNENAYAIQHSGDAYFSDSTLEAWELKYCLDNDTTRFAWADDTNGKGVIYYMKDEFENECPYDFKNIQFPRYKITECTKSPDLVGQYSVSGLSDVTVDTATTYWCYTFSMIDFNNDNLAHDVSVEQDKYLGDEGFCYKQQNNIIKEYYGTFYGDTNINYLFLPDNVFVTDTDICSIGEGYGEFYGFYSNLLGNNNFHNSFGNECNSNSFGNECCNNLFGNDCHNNSFGNACGDNTFGNECYNNSFGNECYNNLFGNDCYNNSFGNACHNNSFGNACYNNSFGNACGDNTFGNECNSNSFGNCCNYITFAKDYMYYNIVENGNQYITVTSTQTTSSSSVIRNFTIAQGVNNSTTLKTISHNTVNDTFKTTYQNSNSTVVNV